MTRAPELPGGLRGPLLAERIGLHETLAGTVRLVLFWRTGCVHSRHALADLATLTERFQGRAVSTLAVHVPVHPAELDEQLALAECALHPVPPLLLQDATHEAARAYGVRSLPTLAIVDAKGELRFCGGGEPHLHRTADAVEHLLAAVPGAVPAPLLWQLRGLQAVHHDGLLAVPAALCVQGDRLWVVDAARHRVVQADLGTQRVERVVGSGHPGMSDGEPEGAAFRTPMGACPVEGGLLVADTGNHSLRLVAADTGNVMTVCGNGVRGSDRFGGGFGGGQTLSSPRALLSRNGGVVVAMAGSHQLWQFDPTTEAAMAWVGTGAPGHVDGDQEAQFREPLALCAGDGGTWVADAGNGAVRFVDDAHGRTRTVARGLARPAAVAWDGSVLWVADPWQQALLRVAPDGTVVTALDRASGIERPCAVVVHGGSLLLADAARDGGRVWRVMPRGDGCDLARIELQR
ncbi:MAG: hypothetical protein RL148_79 [Planctomycetota bacterium]